MAKTLRKSAVVRRSKPLLVYTVSCTDGGGAGCGAVGQSTQCSPRNQHARGLSLVGQIRLPASVTQQQQRVMDASRRFQVRGGCQFGISRASPVPEADNNNPTKTRKHGQRGGMTQMLMRFGKQSPFLPFRPKAGYLPRERGLHRKHPSLTSHKLLPVTHGFPWQFLNVPAIHIPGSSLSVRSPALSI